MAIYLLPGGMYYTLNMLLPGFCTGKQTQSVLSIEDLLLPGIILTYTITDVYKVYYS